MSRRVDIDAELLELFADDPESLAIVDAIAATQQRPASRRRRQLALVAVATIAISIAIGLFTQQASHAGVIARALRALNEHSVLHLTLAEARVDGELVDLRTGARLPLRHQIDEWYDNSRGIRGLRDSVRGIVVAQSRGPIRKGATTSDINSFVQAYRQALTRRDVNSIKSGRIGDQPVYWILFKHPIGMRVAVARMTARPVLIRYGSGAATRDFRVTEWGGAEKVPTVHPAPRNNLSGQLRRLSPSAQPSVGEQSAIESLRRVDGLPVLRFTNRFSVVGSGMRAYEFAFAVNPVHGQITGRYMRLAVSRQPFVALGWTSVEASIPRQSLMILAGRPTYAFAHLDTAYVAIETTLSRSAVVASVRALQDK